MKKRDAMILLVLVLLAMSVPVVVTLRPNVEPAAPPSPGDTPTPPEAVPPAVVAPTPPGVEDADAQAPPPPDATAAPPRGSRDPGGAGREPDPGFFGIFTGEVVDIRNGDPIVGAKIAYGPDPARCWSVKTGVKGRFSISINPGKPYGTPWRIRVTATGFETWEAVPRTEAVRVELIPVTYVSRPGRIRGHALDRDGRPLTGVVRIVLGDSSRFNHYLAVQADDDGDFLLEGVKPGGCRIRHLNGKDVEIFVPEDDEVPVTIRTRRTREELDRQNHDTQVFGKLTLALRSARNAHNSEKARGAEPADLARLQEDVENLVRRIKDHVSKSRRRAVRVTGIPGPDGTRITCESSGGSSTERWWGLVRNGETRFPALHEARWILTLKLPSGDVVADASVGEKGDVVFTPRNVKPTTEPK